MLWTLLAKELRESLLSLKLQVAFLAACALAAIGSVLLVVDCQRALEDHGQRARAHAQLLDELDDETLSYGAVADLPLRPWERLIRGAAAGRDQPVFVGFLFEPYFLRHLAEVSANEVYASVDLGFLTTVVMSLLALLFTYDAFTREREEGTLALCCANQVPRDAMVMAYLTARGEAIGWETFTIWDGLPGLEQPVWSWQRWLADTAIDVVLLALWTTAGIVLAVAGFRRMSVVPG